MHFDKARKIRKLAKDQRDKLQFRSDLRAKLTKAEEFLVAQACHHSVLKCAAQNELDKIQMEEAMDKILSGTGMTSKDF